MELVFAIKRRIGAAGGCASIATTKRSKALVDLVVLLEEIVVEKSSEAMLMLRSLGDNVMLPRPLALCHQDDPTAATSAIKYDGTTKLVTR